MKIFKLGLRFWIGLTSLSSFFGGWILLAHAPKPAQSGASSSTAPSVMATPLPTLAPLAPIQGFSAQNNSPFQNTPVIIQPTAPPANNFFAQQPVFTTGGS